MARFKVGDRVRRHSGRFAGMKVGDEAVVVEVVGKDYMHNTHYKLSGFGSRQHSEASLELVELIVENE